MRPLTQPISLVTPPSFARVTQFLALPSSAGELAELAKLTPARVNQIMNLLGLAPDIQEEIFFLPPVTDGRPAVSERDLRQALKTVAWSEQRERWAAIRQIR
jgi:hypothetical protein